MLRLISQIEDSKINGRTVLIRVDFNVSISKGSIGEDYRIRMSLPSIEYLTKRGAKVVLASHLGRPRGPQQEYSLQPVAERLSSFIGNSKVRFVSDSIGEVVSSAIERMQNGDILMLENLRFYREEELNDPKFAGELASLADIYVNDAFSTSHRKHASTYGAAKLFDTRLAGFNLNKEVEYLSMIRENPIKPFKLVVGGVKIRDKIDALENLLPKAEKLVLGGAVAYTFLKAKGVETGKSIIDEAHLPWVTDALSAYGDKILLPSDHIVAESANAGNASIVSGNIPTDMAGFDIGNETLQRYSAEVSRQGPSTVFWNGPMGMFELGLFANGTVSMAKSIALGFWRGSNTLIGGGDTLEALKRAGVSETEVSHVSTGGGATLRFLAGDEMPGIVAIDQDSA
jgi:phosphoglycerate kinase